MVFSVRNYTRSVRHGTSSMQGRKPARRKLSHWQTLVAGGIAGVCAKTVIAPLERLKIIFQASDEAFRLRSVPTVVRRIWVSEGVRALWRGHAATMLRVFPLNAIKFASFDILKSAATTSPTTSPSSPGLTRQQSLLFGGVAAGMATLGTYPLELTRARLAVMPNRFTPPSPTAAAAAAAAAAACTKHGRPPARASLLLLSSSSSSEIASLWTTWIRVGGVRALYRGVLPSLVGTVPYGALSFGLNDQVGWLVVVLQLLLLVVGCANGSA